MDKVRFTFPSFLSGIINSYPQIFFSESRIFAVILLLVSFFDLWAGISGLLAVVVSNSLAYLLGLNEFNIKKGYYGFNSLLVGLGLGVYYQPGAEFLLVLAFSSILTLFLTLWFEGALAKYGLPYLSMPFLAGLWLVSLATRQFTALHVSERGIYMTNEMFLLGGSGMVESYNWITNLGLPESIRLYFTSLGAIFFQYHLFAGILVAAGLLIYSRIAFTLSLTGFFSAYLYYNIIGADIHELSYSFIGFNFILTSIAIGGFFIIPSKWSFLWVILLTPLVSIILTSTQAIFSIFQLSVYSLPFNMVVLLFLYALKFRERFFDKPELVSYQQYSPEINLYAHLNYKSRFGKTLFFPFTLPFWGEWKVTQAHNGPLTHQGEWKHAWDFEVTDHNGNTFNGSGNDRDDYYCFNKPVIAPADGWIETVVDDVEENEIGRVNLENNWGNTIVIRHGDHLFSKLSHLKKGSIKVTPGNHIKRGEVIGSCGNSGRSPIPHLHFQIQATPYIGSKTLDYPISHYIRHSEGSYNLHSWDTPENEFHLSNINKNSALVKAFQFIPGQKLTLRVHPDGQPTQTLEWEVELSPANTTFIHCRTSRSKAWFKNDGDIHYFTHFEGDRSSLLFRFYLGAFKIMMGYYPDLVVKDTFPVHTFNNTPIRIIQDFAAPFVRLTKSEYTLHYLSMEDDLSQIGIRLKSVTRASIGNFELKKLVCEMFIGSHGIEQIVFHEKQKSTEITLIAG